MHIPQATPGLAGCCARLARSPSLACRAVGAYYSKPLLTVISDQQLTPEAWRTRKPLPASRYPWWTRLEHQAARLVA